MAENMKLAVMAVMMLPVAISADEWRGHLSTLRQAQIECADSDSRGCVPFLAAAVAVADVLNLQAKTIMPTKSTPVAFDIVFHSGSTERCSAQWLKSLNGLSLMHTALGLTADEGEQNVFWTDALIRAARLLCHS
jgi:hypothetical protein